MKKGLFFLIVLLILATIVYGLRNNEYPEEARPKQQKIETHNSETASGVMDQSIVVQEDGASSIPGLELPKTKPSDVVITHTGYSLLYNETHEQADWVAYELTKEETNKIYSRTDNFIPDPMVSTGTATNADYKNSGYDRGHLAPAADMGWSATAMAESFYYSNMSPQNQSFNRGIWKKLEEQVRTWAIENSAVYITTGPVLKPGLPTIGINKVSVPKYYYKVILDYTEPELKAIGFIIPNLPSKAPLQNYAVTIDSVEKFTGINFFWQLPNEQENEIEKKICLECWSWKTIKTSTPAVSSTPKNKSGSVQCSGTTKAGNRCKRMTKSTNGRCYQHGGN